MMYVHCTVQYRVSYPVGLLDTPISAIFKLMLCTYLLTYLMLCKTTIYSTLLTKLNYNACASVLQHCEAKNP